MGKKLPPGVGGGPIGHPGGAWRRRKGYKPPKKGCALVLVLALGTVALVAAAGWRLFS